MRRHACAVLLLLLQAACGSSSDPEPGPDAAPAAELVIDWSPCPVLTDGTGLGAECADIAVPADWGDPDRDTVALFLKRIQKEGASKQVWMLNGGPGASGADFDPLAEQLVEENPELAFYLLDHRGTGRSTRLGCPAQEADDSPHGRAISAGERAACVAAVEAEVGDRLPFFTTSNAAQDLGHLIEATREGYDQVHVWGGSYGTLWGQRYLHFFPDQATAITLTGIAPPDASFTHYDADYDRVARDYLAACDRDPHCADKLGGEAAARIAALYDDLDAGHCPAAAGLTPAALRGLFATWLLWAWYERALIPAIAYRLERCDPDDLAALAHFAALFRGGEESAADRLHSAVLGLHIGVSELSTPPYPTSGEAQAVVDGTVVSLAVGPRYAELWPTWPAYPPDGFDDQFAATDIPVLMLEGELDPATVLPGARRVADALDGPDQHFVVLPGAGHSFTTPASGEPLGCQLRMWMDFVADPHAAPGDCPERMVPLDFGRQPALAEFYFGTRDLWEGGPTARRRARDGAVEARFRELRQHMPRNLFSP